MTVPFSPVLDGSDVHQNNGKMDGLPVRLVLVLVERLQRERTERDDPRRSEEGSCGDNSTFYSACRSMLVMWSVDGVWIGAMGLAVS
mmetsp:Transcript_19708/g.29613  ORF Transcript_19708/g.29613 Transcript_19708/m.29613 type:complete len:87 (-) Transcript_19708:292-552(-)